MIPFVSVFCYSNNLGKQYDETYLGAMSDKFERLQNINEPKIILVGGSNLPFGINSELLQEKTGFKVVNFGLYAALGSKTTMDLSKSNINKNDIVIFVPEFSKQTYSKYVNGEIILQVLDSDYSMFWNIPMNDYFPLINAYPEFLGQKKSFVTNNAKPTGNGVYSRDAFNEYGDIKIARPYNIMPDQYDSTNLITINKDIISTEFIDYFNKYAEFVKQKGAKTFFSFPPVNKLALEVDNTDERDDFYNFVKNNFNANIISNIDNFIMDEGYFYDTNYHLNDSGVTVRTANLIGDINRTLGNTSPINITYPLPSGALEELGIDIDNNLLNNENNAEMFDYQIFNDKITILGLSAKGKLQSELIIPSIIENKLVYKIADRAFESCTNLEALVINSNITVFGDKIFNGATNLTSVTLNLDEEKSNLPLASEILLQGCNSNLQIYVSRYYYGIVSTDYIWGKFANFYAIK